MNRTRKRLPLPELGLGSEAFRLVGETTSDGERAQAEQSLRAAEQQEAAEHARKHQMELET